MKHDEVHDQASFVRYVVRLVADMDDPILALKWENADIRSLLEAMEAWATDSVKPANPNPWRHAADVLRAGITYD